MLHITSHQELTEYVNTQKEKGNTIGFVPTLGALHQGHMSLINKASESTNIIICSIFLNPTQFDDPKDLEKYPQTLQNDLKLLEQNDCDVCFTPTVKEVYPDGQISDLHYNLGHLEDILEGATRPGHYQGVAQVVHRLLVMVNPDVLFLGQKDYQQVQVLSKMIIDFNLPVNVEMCPIIREDDGLAMSSRNVRLEKEEREVANELYKTLVKCKENFDTFSIRKLQHWGIENLNQTPLITVDYLMFCDAKTLEEIKAKSQSKHIVLLAAINLGAIRLIDNMIIC